MSEVITVKAKIDIEDSIQQIKEFGQAFNDIKKEAIEAMPNVTKILDSSIEKTTGAIDSLISKKEKLEKDNFQNNQDRDNTLTSVEENIKDINIMRQLQLGTGDYSNQLARSWLSGLPKSIQAEFDAIAPQVTNIIRSRINGFSKDGTRNSVGNINSFQFDLDDDPRMKAIKNGLSDNAFKQYDRFLSVMTHNAVPMYLTNDYQNARFGSIDNRGAKSLLPSTPRALLEDKAKSFVESFDAQKYQQQALGPELASMILSEKSRNDFSNTLERNPVAVKAAIKAGLARRDDRGELELKKNISARDFEGYREALYDEFVVRAAGTRRTSDDGSVYSTDPEMQRKVVNRMLSSSSGKAVMAMQDAEKYIPTSSWSLANILDDEVYLKQKEAKRILDQYAVEKYNPFTQFETGKGLQLKDSRLVNISESQNTRLLGRGRLQNNQNISDLVSLISLEGYDENNPEHVSALRKLYSEGIDIDGKRMVAQSTHGTGIDTVIRMIDKAEYERIEKEENEWAKKNGFSGNYWKNFADTELQRRASLSAEDKDRLTTKILGKQYDAENKNWSPTYDTGINVSKLYNADNDKGIKIALVDFDGEDKDKKISYGDGQGYLPSSILPKPIQGRFGVAGKGSLGVFNVSNNQEWSGANREFAAKAGLLIDDKWMVKGIDGKQFDISGYSGFIPTSLIKNMNAFRKADGSLPTNEEASEMLTALISRYGIGAITEYQNESSDKLGSQMSAFLKLDPELTRSQTSGYLKRMQELDTPEGALKYVFSDPNSSALSMLVNKNRQLLSSPEAQDAIERYKQSLTERVASGEIIDFGEDKDSKITNTNFTANPLYAYLMSNGDLDSSGKLKNHVLSRAKTTLYNATNKQYSDEEIMDLINLKPGTVIDFSHIDDDNIGVLRSPTGYGNMVYAKNIAKEAKPLYDEFGINKQGIYVSKSDEEVLQGLDYDGDTGKVVTGKFADAVKRTVDAMGFVHRDIQSAPIEYGDDISDDALQRTHAASRSVTMPQKAGSASGVSIRGVQVDLSNPINNPYIIGMQEGQALYDAASTDPKNPQKVTFSKEAWDVLRLGKEYGKFAEHISDLFNVDEFRNENGDIPDDVLKDRSKVLKTSNGTLINMKALNGMDIGNINVPSVNVDSYMVGTLRANEAYKYGLSDTRKWDAVSEAIGMMDYGNAGPQTKKLMMTMRQSLPQFGSGQRVKFTPEEEISIAKMLHSSEQEVRENASKYLDPITGRYNRDGVEYKSLNDYLNAHEKPYMNAKRVAENAINEFGPTNTLLAGKLGIDTLSNMINAQGLMLNTYDISEEELKKRQANDEIAIKISQKAEEEAKKRIEQRHKNNNEESEVTQEEIDQEKKRIEDEARAKRLQANMTANNESITEEQKTEENNAPTIKPKKTRKNNKSSNKEQTEEELIKEINELEIERKKAEEDYINKLISNSDENIPSDEEFNASQKKLSDIESRIKEKQNKLNKIKSSNSHVNEKAQLTAISNAEFDPTKTLQENFEPLLNGLAERETSKIVVDKLMESMINTSKDFRKDIYSGKEQTTAEKYFGYKNWERWKTNKDYDYAMEVAGDSMNEATKNMLFDQRNQINSEYIEATKNWTKNRSTSLVDRLNKMVNPNDEVDKQNAIIESYDKKINELTSTLEQFKKSREELYPDSKYPDGKLPEEDRQVINQVFDDITTARELRSKGIENLVTNNVQSLQDINASLSKDPFQSITSGAEKARTNVDKLIASLQNVLKAQEPSRTDEQINQLVKERLGFDPSKLYEMIDKNENLDIDKRRTEIAHSQQNLLAQIEGRPLTENEQKRQALDNMSLRIRSTFNDLNEDAQRELLKKYEDTYDNQYASRLIASRNNLEQQHSRVDQQLMRMNQYDMQRTGVYDNSFAGQVLRMRDSNQSQLAYQISSGESLLASLQQKQLTQTEGTDAYAQTASDINRLEDALNRARTAMEGLDGASGIAQTAMTKLSQSVTNAIQRFGRQMFQKAINETKKFVVEFSSSMSQIQAITMKSDTEMDSIRKQTIDKAIKMKAPVSDVAKVETDLYRQGLSDSEVSDRTDAIMKFATVSGTKVADATKIITTALQNGLVGSAQEAMDALVALGDSAATTAEQIGKAMQKCAAAAKVAGVSYSELTAMLTTMTSMTQLSGTQIGTAMNTILSRMHKVTSTGLAKDINGETTGINDIEKALSSVGISLRDAKTGEWVPTSQVLLQLAQQWDSINDIQKSNITTTMAGTRAGNLFTTLMEGMSEDNGETFAKYLGLAENSEGITESKYDIIIKNITASINEMKSAFDGFVESLENDNIISGVFEGIASLFENLTSFTEHSGGIVSALSLVAAAVTAFIAKIATAATLAKTSVFPIASLLSTLAGLAVAGIGIGIVGGIGDLQNNDEESIVKEKQKSIETKDSYISTTQKKIDSYKALIDKTKELGKSYDELGNKMDSGKSLELENNLKNLVSIFPQLGTSISDTTGILEQWATIVKGANDSVSEIEETSKKTAKVLSHNAAAKNFNDEVEQALSEVSDAALPFTQEDIDNLRTQSKISIEPATGEPLFDFLSNSFSAKDIMQFSFPNNPELIDYLSNNVLLNNKDLNDLLLDDYGFNLNEYARNIMRTDGSYKQDAEKIKNGILSYFTSNTDVSKYDKELLDFMDAIGISPQKILLGYTEKPKNLRDRSVNANGISDYINSALENDPNNSNLLALKKYFITDFNEGKYNMYNSSSISRFVDAFGTMEPFAPIYSNIPIDYSELSNENWENIISKFSELQDVPQQIIDAILNAFDASEFIFTDEQKNEILNNIFKNSGIANGESDAFASSANTSAWLQSFAADGPQGVNRYGLFIKGYSNGNEKDTTLGLLKYMYENNYFSNSQNWLENGFPIYENVDAFIEDANAGFAKMLQAQGENNWFNEVVEGLYSAVTDENNSVIYSYFEAVNKQMQDVLNGQVKNFHDKYSSDARFMDDESGLVEKAVMNYVTSKAINDGYVDDKGNVVYSTDWVNDTVLGDYFESAYESLVRKYNKWGQEVGLREFLNDNGIKPEDYPYQFNGQGYSSLEEARNAAKKFAGIDKESEYTYEEQSALNKAYSQITSGDKQVYDSAGNIVASQMQNYLLNNKDYKTDLMTMLTFAQAAGNIEEFNKVAPTDNLNAILNANTELNAIWSAVTNGSNLFKFEDLQSALMNAYAGTPIFSPEMFEEKMNAMFGTENQTFMERLMNGNFGTETDRSTYLDYLQQDEATKQMMSSMRDEYSSLGPIFDALVSGAGITSEQVKAFNEEFNEKNSENIREYGENLQTVVDNVYKLRKGTATEKNSVLSGMRQRAQTVNDNEYYRKQFEAGKMSNEIASYYSSVSGYDAEYIKKNKDVQKELLSQNDIYRQMDLDALKPDAETLMEMLQQGVQNDPEFANMVINGVLPGITYNLETGELTVNTGEVDSSVVQNATYQALDAAATSAADMEVKAQMKIDQSVDANGDTIVATAKATLGGVTVSGLGKNTGAKQMKKSGGGGGGGKSKVDKLLEQLQRKQKLGEHRIKMIQYQEADYKDDSQLGNYGKAVEEENRVRKEYAQTLDDNLESLKKEFAATKKDSDDWYKLRDAILQAEEAIEENNKAIEDNVRLLAENHQAILKLHTDLEQLIVDEIEARKQKERDMLDGTVQMETQILNIIQERYRKEWELERQGIEKKKEALEEEKRLLQERLDARKEAED